MQRKKLSRRFLLAITVAITWPVIAIGQTVNIDNGVVGDGHLDVNVDAYGAYGNFNAAYVDNFQPAGSTSSQPTFSAGFRLFSGTDKVLLTDMAEWLGVLPALDPATWNRNITAAVANSTSSSATSSFEVTNGAGAAQLSFDVTQSVSAASGGVAILAQTYTITNVSGGALDFNMNRVLDADLVWDGDFLSDHVSLSDSTCFVGQHEPGSTTQAMALGSGADDTPHTYYWGAKNTHEPTGGMPAMGFGTDVIQWGENGLPATWQNYIAFVGYDTPGDSGTDANDGHIGLDWELSLADGESATITVRTLYGALSLDGVVCSEDCVKGDVNQDGEVDLLDVAPFVDLVTGGAFQCEGDINDDGEVDLLDVAGFVAILTGG